MWAYVRFDPAGGLTLRAYTELVDTSAPLHAMTKEFSATAHVTIAGDTAEVTGLHGVVSRHAYRDFERQLRLRGIRRVFWERHREDGTVKLVVRNLA